MRKQLLCVIGCVLSVMLCGACRQTHSMTSESGLYDVKLVHNPKVAVDGVWLTRKPSPYQGRKKGSIYIAPLDISKVVQKQPKLAPLMVPQMHNYMVQYVGKALQESNAANRQSWTLAKSVKGADVRVDTALVHFRPQRPGVRIISAVGGVFSKVPGVAGIVGHLAEGDVCLELTIRDVRTGELLVACKDSNRKDVQLISAEAYKRSGNADANLKLWAERLGRFVRACAPDVLGNSTLREKLKERSFWSVLKASRGY